MFYNSIVLNGFLESTNTVLCGSLTCPETANTCAVTKTSSEDLIITTHECRLGKEVLRSNQSKTPNKYKVSVNSFASFSIGQPTAEDTQRVYKSIQDGYAFSKHIQDEIQSQIRANFANTFDDFSFPFFGIF